MVEYVLGSSPTTPKELEPRMVSLRLVSNVPIHTFVNCFLIRCINESKLALELRYLRNLRIYPSGRVLFQHVIATCKIFQRIFDLHGESQNDAFGRLCMPLYILHRYVTIS